MFERGVENVLIVLIGKEIGDGFRYHCAEPFDIVDLRAGLRALECSPCGAPACCNEMTGNLDRSTRRFTAARAGGDSTMAVGYYNIT
jgi:hypothetical protein